MRPVDESALATKRSIGQYAETLPLRFTAERGMRATARILLEAGAEPDGRLCEGRATALMMAAAEGHEGIAQMLLDYGAGLESVGRDQTPLEWAAFGGRPTTVRLLLDHGAARTADAHRSADRWKHTPERQAEHTATISMFLAAGK
ncbi:ankyrin repeat domain-containing protein [Streptomyces niveus]|uniref:ankyrin repeat domain-containing protein n=1 Tax=Streptomyces niveus TaxID=193462 RepID=UPI00084CAE6A|nr:ankyrin repeat domain-containing protein [Streptomyces niveus]